MPHFSIFRLRSTIWLIIVDRMKPLTFRKYCFQSIPIVQFMDFQKQSHSTIDVVHNNFHRMTIPIEFRANTYDFHSLSMWKNGCADDLNYDWSYQTRRLQIIAFTNGPEK